MKRIYLAVAALSVLTACGGNDSASNPSAIDTASQLKGKVSSITKTVKITEDNDPNDDIGRPGKYQQAVSIYDSRAKCDSKLDVSCGAKVEVYADADSAKTRKEYLEAVFKDAPILGSEYDYLDGATLLRVTGQLKPSEAKEYEAAFTG